MHACEGCIGMEGKFFVPVPERSYLRWRKMKA